MTLIILIVSLFVSLLELACGMYFQVGGNCQRWFPETCSKYFLVLKARICSIFIYDIEICLLATSFCLKPASLCSTSALTELHFARSFQRYPTWPYLARSNMYPNTVFGARIWVRQIWSSEVSLKRSYKMQFRCIGFRSIGPPSQK